MGSNLLTPLVGIDITVGDHVQRHIFGLTIDMEKRLVTREGDAIKLTPREYDLLCALAANPGRVMTHGQILTAVWGPAHKDDTQYLRVFVGQLRAKIERDPSRPTIIRTESGVGYRFAESA